MLTGLWCVGIKVGDLERELAFHRQMGHEIVLDETYEFNGETFRVPLVKMGDKYLSLTEKLIYERTLGEARPVGSTHMVYISSSFEADVAKALASGAVALSEVGGTISAGFGERRVAFLRAPGGWIFEIIQVIRNLVPEV
jgi:hypothetical protein